jgi:hypothetical protein
MEPAARAEADEINTKNNKHAMQTGRTRIHALTIDIGHLYTARLKCLHLAGNIANTFAAIA